MAGSAAIREISFGTVRQDHCTRLHRVIFAKAWGWLNHRKTGWHYGVVPLPNIFNMQYRAYKSHLPSLNMIQFYNDHKQHPSFARSGRQIRDAQVASGEGAQVALTEIQELVEPASRQIGVPTAEKYIPIKHSGYHQEFHGPCFCLAKAGFVHDFLSHLGSYGDEIIIVRWGHKQTNTTRVHHASPCNDVTNPRVGFHHDMMGIVLWVPNRFVGPIYHTWPDSISRVGTLNTACTLKEIMFSVFPCFLSLLN